MTGPDKQQAWANQIKQGKMAELDEFEVKYNALVEQATPEQITPLVTATLAAIDTLRSNEDHRYWIDNRDYGVTYLLKQIVSEAGLLS
jgi:hypothetical protein